MRLVIQPYQKKKEGTEKPPPTKFCTPPLPCSLTNGNTINVPCPQSTFQKCHKDTSQGGTLVTMFSIIREVGPNPAHEGLQFTT